jgi:hypothetical protein
MLYKRNSSNKIYFTENHIYTDTMSLTFENRSRPRYRSVNNDSILFVKNMQTLKTGGKTASVTVSTALLNQRLAISNAPRMLTPSEIKLLRQSKSEIADYVQKVYPDRESLKRARGRLVQNRSPS